MSLWYDLKKKSYATNGKESWIKSYCDRALESMSQKLLSHFGGAEGRHKAEDIDFDGKATVKEKIEQGFNNCMQEDENLSSRIETEKAERTASFNEVKEELQNELLVRGGMINDIREDIAPVLLMNELKDATLDEEDNSVLCIDGTGNYSAEGLELSFKAPCSKNEISRIDLTISQAFEVEEPEELPEGGDDIIEVPDIEAPDNEKPEPVDPSKKVESFTFKNGKDFKEWDYVTVLFSGTTVEVKEVYETGFFDYRISDNKKNISWLKKSLEITDSDVTENWIDIMKLKDKTNALEEFKDKFKDLNNSATVDNETLSKVVFSAGDGKLKVVTTSKPDEISLDTVAYEDKTYRDIFVTNNLTPWGSFEDGISGFSTKGAPEVTDEVYQSGSHALKCFGVDSNYINTTKTVNMGTQIYFACSARVERYVSGKFGVQTVSGSISEAYFSNTTNGFEIASNIRTATSSANLGIYVGAWSTPDVDGYIDDVVIIDLSMFSVAPTKDELDRLYNNYIGILTGKGATGDKETYIISEKAVDVDFTDAQCINAFMEKVNEKAEELGMTNSDFVTPSGAGTENAVTSKDLVRLFVGATAYDNLMKVWGKPSKTICTKNETPVQHDLTSTMYADMNTEQPVTNGITKSPYYFMGGKTGSWQAGDKVVYNFGAICKVKDKLVVGVVMDSGSQANRYTAINKLFEIAEDIIENGTSDITSVISDSACCCILPEYNPNMYEGYPLEFLFEQNADTQIIPASVTKVITSMVMLDYVKDMDETIEFVQSDLIGGSGNIFNAGDIITYKDALYAMMLPSSNAAAQAVARCVGNKILRKSCK